jgi:hypothetical protein
MTWLYQSNALGSYPDREEFQVERVIVWVKTPSHGSRATWLERANLILGEVWQAIPAAVSAAQQASRTLIPEFWEAHDQAGTAAEQLAVRGIWIDPASGSADYEVARNPDFDREGLPEFPDDLSIIVSRDPSGALLARGLRPD